MAAVRAVAMQSKMPTQSCIRPRQPSGPHAASAAPSSANGKREQRVAELDEVEVFASNAQAHRSAVLL